MIFESRICHVIDITPRGTDSVGVRMILTDIGFLRHFNKKSARSASTSEEKIFDQIIIVINS